MARPKAKIDPEEVFKLASIGCKVKEIADWFGVIDDTISNRFSGELEKGRASLKMSLRRWQLEAAKNGNATMLVWLGKQMLGQTDKTIEEIEADISLKKAIVSDPIQLLNMIEAAKLLKESKNRERG
jgi:hypothetical protein